MADKRDKRKITKRSPGLVITPPAPRPAEDNPALQLFREVKEAEAEGARQTQTGAETGESHPPPTTHHPPPTTQSAAPLRDFSRVANSITRSALPAGLFRGESKKLYDALYLRTRGAVVPRRQLRATQADLMDWARISHNTLKAHLKHLTRVGLLKIHYVRGDNTGAEYEIFTPEEASQQAVLAREEVSPKVTETTTHHPPPTTQNLGPPTTQILGGGWWGKLPEESTIYENRNTFLKTDEKIDDDEALAGFARVFEQASREVTGKGLLSAEAARWKELAELLSAELKIAAARTSVSSVPAFLTEHLRRRLWKKEKSQVEQERREGESAAAPPVDASQCPDCRGTGYFYPQGFDAGVARCRHEKLTAQT